MIRLVFLSFLIFLSIQASAQCVRNEPAVQMQIQLTLDAATDSSESNSGVGVANAGNSSGRESSSTGEHSHEFSPDMNIRVELQDSFGTRVGDATPNGEGRVSFTVCPRSEFRLRVTGSFIEEATAENLSPGHGDHMVSVSLRHKGAKKPGGKATESSISTSRFKIPKAAQKELAKGNSALSQGDTVQAQAHFEKAIAAYPQFDQAYNNLGVALVQRGDHSGAKAAFQKAVAINEHFSRALTNLARIALEERQFSQAFDFVRRSLTMEPLNTKTLMIGTESAYFSGNYDQTVNYARILHSLQHTGMALAHYLSAKSLEKVGRENDAIAEYQRFLSEEPNDPNAKRAQMAIIEIQASRKPVN